MFEAGEGATDDAGAIDDARAEVGRPQVPNADWHPVPQYSAEFPKQIEIRVVLGEPSLNTLPQNPWAEQHEPP